MTADKGMRVATAAGFLAGILACLDALRDVKVYWPPDAVWVVLQSPKRFELGFGIALIVISLIVSIARSRRI
jgi:hypothetical protein